jgi:hypothetical protein
MAKLNKVDERVVSILQAEGKELTLQELLIRRETSRRCLPCGNF